MKVVIFCGGYGTRFWPISRKSTPKQFVHFLSGKSFFQLTYARYRKQFAPEVPRNNIIAEPERKDLLGACGLATAIVDKYFPGETVLISWAKHLIARESVFLNAVMAAGEYASKTGVIVSVGST